MDVAVWLRSLGLEQYETLFRENDIDAEVLSDLTDGDLEKIGVSLGHRKRLLRAVEALPSPAPALPPAATAIPRVADVAERRQLTVMFCDLVGSTALSARLDPEDMREVIRAYQDACSGAIARYDGFVAKFMGDGVLAYFGFPRAHEEDAERAVRAGLDIAAAVAKLETRGEGEPEGPHRRRDRHRRRRRSHRAGLGAGTGRRRRHAQSGGAAAGPGRAGQRRDRRVDAAAARRHVRVEAARASNPQGLRRAGSRLDGLCARPRTSAASRRRGRKAMTPFVGREHEVALLLDRWRDASEGEGQVVLLSGEAGIGKSRILAALRERIGDEPHMTLRYQCSPHHVNDAFYPITSQIWHAAGFVSGEPPAARLDKLEAMIARSGLEAKEIAPLLAALLSIPGEGRYPALEMAPERTEGADDRGADRAVRGADQGRPCAGAAGGRALDRPHVARRVRPARRSAAGPARAAGDNLPAGVRRALGRPRACHLAVAQPLRAASGRRDDRSASPAARRCRRRCSSRSSPRPTACRCSWRN